jgi:hypothetical protein
MINIIFKNNTKIRILATELLNTILILDFEWLKYLLISDGVPWQFEHFFSVT